MIALLKVGVGDDGRGVVLSGGKAALATGTMSPLPLIPPPDGDAAALAAWERAMGEALLDALSVGSRLSVMRGLTEAEGGILALAIDARTDAMRALPWEVLVGHAGVAHVVRLVEGVRGREPTEATRAEVRPWVADREEASCAQVSAALLGTFDNLRRVRATNEPAGEGALKVVHLVTRGADALAGVLHASATERRWADPAMQAMGDTLDHADVVIADVSHESPQPADRVGPLAARIVSGGAAVCVAPGVAMPVEAAIRFSAGFYRALDDGEPLLGAVAAGRRALRALDGSRTSGRWWAPQVFAADLDLLDAGAALTTRARPPAFPEGSPAGELVLADAMVVAEADGWLGVEQFAVALARAQGGDPTLLLLRPLFVRIGHGRPAIERGPGAPRLTLRVQDLASRLSAEWGPSDLARALLRVRWIHALLDAPARARLRSLGVEGVEDPATPPPLASQGGALVFEAVGGPEDGCGFSLAHTGEVLGRHDAAAPVSAGLYRDGPTDRTVSRRHLTWAAPDAVRIFGPTGLARGEDETPTEITGTARLRPGDRLLLGSGTWLTVV